jgi:hypothetical protein
MEIASQIHRSQIKPGQILLVKDAHDHDLDLFRMTTRNYILYSRLLIPISLLAQHSLFT